jgi:hypothetical protein
MDVSSVLTGSDVVQDEHNVSRLPKTAFSNNRRSSLNFRCFYLYEYYKYRYLVLTRDVHQTLVLE